MTPRPAGFRHPGRETLAILVLVPALVLVAAVALVLTHHRDAPPSAAVAAGSGSVVGPAVPGPLAGTSTPQAARPSTPAGRPAAGQSVRAAPAPRLGATLLMRRGSAGVDVRTWQARMAQRGWQIAVDGVYGPQSEAVARSFQHEKRLRTDGRVGRQTWTAAWTTPITAA